MSDKPPCENDDCDICHPIPRWKVSTETVERRVHQREIKAATMEEALAIYAQGTAWPSDYDTHTTEVISEGPPKITGAPAQTQLWRCYNHIQDPDQFDVNEDPDPPEAE